MTQTIIERKIYARLKRNQKIESLGIGLPKTIMNLWNWNPTDIVQIIIDDEKKEITIKKNTGNKGSSTI